MKKQIIFVALLIAGILGCQKNFFTGDLETLDKGFMEAEKIHSPIVASDARAMYEERLSKIPVPETENTNPNDLLPQWDAAGNYNFVDTTDSYLSVPTGKFVGGGYKKLLFMRRNGQLTYIIAHVRGDADYIHRKNGVCEMSDFCGYIFYKNKEGVFFVGFKLENGQIVEILKPNNAPRPEYEEEEPILLDGNVTITATRPSNNTVIYMSGVWGSGSSGDGLSISSIIAAMGGSGGGGGSSGTSMDGVANPIVNNTVKVCPSSFKDTIISQQKDEYGNRRLIDSARSTAGLRNLTVAFNYVDNANRSQKTTITIGYLYLSMPNNCGATFGTMASNAIASAITATETALAGGRGYVSTTITASTFHSRLSDALTQQDASNCAAHHSPTIARVQFLGSLSATETYTINENTQFTNYWSCR